MLVMQIVRMPIKGKPCDCCGREVNGDVVPALWDVLMTSAGPRLYAFPMHEGCFNDHRKHIARHNVEIQEFDLDLVAELAQRLDKTPRGQKVRVEF